MSISPLRILSALLARHRRHQAIERHWRRLAGMNDRMLDDIGLSRADLNEHLHRRLWPGRGSEPRVRTIGRTRHAL